jgi:hypothetical protein
LEALKYVIVHIGVHNFRPPGIADSDKTLAAEPQEELRRLASGGDEEGCYRPIDRVALLDTVADRNCSPVQIAIVSNAAMHRRRPRRVISG